MTSSREVRPGLALADTGYESEANEYLRRRSRLFYAVVLVFALVFYVAVGIIEGLTVGWTSRLLFAPGRLWHFGVMALVFLGYLWLRRGPLPLWALRAFDATGLYLCMAGALGVYALQYRQGMHVMSGSVALFVIARAVIVPCTGKMTFLLSVPAPLAYLAVQLSYGAIYYERDVPASPELFAVVVAIDQVLLWLALFLAAVASHVNFTLRRQVREARQLGQYRLDRKIGAGGMGEVYLAHHAMLRRPSAVKLLHPELTGRDMIERFEREVRQTSRLSHPNTVAIYDYGRTPDGMFYYAMEYLEGSDVGSLVEAGGPLPPARAIHLLLQACGALREAHEQGLVHRDVKAGNLIVTRRGGEYDVLKVVDFGLVQDLRAAAGSSLTQVGHVCGTPETLAPEVLGGAGATPAADQYSLGCVGYLMLTGKHCFNARSAADFIGHHLHTAPVPLEERDPSLPRDLGAVLMRCLAKDPEERHASIAALRDALRGCADAGRWTQDEAEAWWSAHGPKA